MSCLRNLYDVSCNRDVLSFTDVQRTSEVRNCPKEVQYHNSVGKHSKSIFLEIKISG